MPWYYAESGRQVGPVDDNSFQGLVGAGVIRDDTLVWQNGMANWQPYQAVRGPVPPPVTAAGLGAAAAPATDTRFCSECGKPYPAGELVAFGNSVICASCKPVFTQKMMEGARLPGAVQYGGFWIRFGAVVVDNVLLYVVGILYIAILMIFFRIDWMSLGKSQADIMRLLAFEGILVGANLITAAIYETWFVGRYGATPGKMVCHLQIVMADGGKLSYLRALARHFAKYLSGFTLAIGYIMAGIDDEKRSLHDRICDTRVIKK